MKSLNSNPIPSISLNAPLRVDNSTPIVEKSELDRHNKRLFIAGAVFISLMVIADFLIFLLKLKIG